MPPHTACCVSPTAEGTSGGRRDPLSGGARITSANGVTPTSIRVSWRLTHPLEDMANVDGFYVLYRQVRQLLLVALVSFHETANCAHGLCECHFLYRSVIALTVNSLGQQTQFDKAKLDVKLMACKSTLYRLVHG